MSGNRPNAVPRLANPALATALSAETRLSGLVGGQGNTGVVFGFVISKQTAPLCGFEKSNAQQRIERPPREGLVACWAMLRLAFQSVVGASRPRVCAGITRATAEHLTARAEK
jgi:hypothetical protein